MEPEGLTAAHLTFPFGTVLRVTDPENGRSVVVVVNDRGPYIDGRILDLSYGAAKAIDMVRKGVAPVHIEVIKVDQSRLATRWRIQIGSFREESAAKELAYEIEREGHRLVEIARFRKSERVYYRVWVGEFVYRADAEDLAREFRRDGRKTVIMQTLFGDDR